MSYSDDRNAAVGLRARSALKPYTAGDDDDLHRRPWRRKILYSIKSFSLTWHAAFRVSLFISLLAAVALVLHSLPVEQVLKDFLLWVKEELGPWGPLALAIAYIPLTVVAVPASVLTLGGGYLFGLPVGFVADSIGATLGATAALFVGRTIGRSYVKSKIKSYPKFQAIDIAIRNSGFKIVLLLRLTPLLPFTILNYLLSVTPVRLVEYMLATWLGMMPITFALVYVGTTLKDISDVTHGWNEVTTTRLIFIASGFVISVVVILYITKVAKVSLEKALAENAETDGSVLSPGLPIVTDSAHLEIQTPLVIKIDPSSDDHLT